MVEEILNIATQGIASSYARGVMFKISSARFSQAVSFVEGARSRGRATERKGTDWVNVAEEILNIETRA